MSRVGRVVATEKIDLNLAAKGALEEDRKY